MEYYAHSVKGKPYSIWQLLEDHLKETADLASIFASKANLANMGRLSGLLHDIGKYSNAFQEYLKSAAGKQDPDAESADSKETNKTDHSSAGAQMIWESLRDGDSLSRFLAQAVALCIASHHTGLIDCLSPAGRPPCGGVD